MGHQHAHSQQIVHRLSRVIGHLEAIRGMVESDRDCSEVLTQLAAVKAAVNSIGRAVLKEHISHCIAGIAHCNKIAGRLAVCPGRCI